MRIIFSVQSKRGSSRGLVHYLAHSKLDPDREPERGRELFNSFTDELSVKSANNFLRADCGNGRPSNEQLHHLVISFKPEDFEHLGKSDKERKKRIKIVTRAAIAQLEKSLNCDSLAWAGAVHLNTGNPHVHLAIQKHYQTRDLKGRFLSKISRESLPHFEIIDGERTIFPGTIIDAANSKLDELLKGRNSSRDLTSGDRDRTGTSNVRETSDELKKADNTDERETLRVGLLAEFDLKYREAKITQLLEQRRNLRFPVVDPDTGLKQKISIQELEDAGSGNLSQLNQAKAISHSLLAKKESAFFELQENSQNVRSEADKIKERCRKAGTKIPPPSFSKKELDHLQENSLKLQNTRDFSYLEQIRIELENRNEIPVRDAGDIERLKAQRVVADLRTMHKEKVLNDFNDNAYYRKIQFGNERISLAQIDRQINGENPSNRNIIQAIGSALKSMTEKESIRLSKGHYTQLKESLTLRLNEQTIDLQKELQKGRKISEVLSVAIDRNENHEKCEARFTAAEVSEIDFLSRTVRLPHYSRDNWNLQKRHLVNSSAQGHGAVATDPENAIEGRAIAREILCKIEMRRSKERLEFYRKSKRFHKFEIDDRKTGAHRYASLNDVELPLKASVLDHALNFLIEGKDHRNVRHQVENRAKSYEQRLKDDLTAAKELYLEAAKEAAPFNKTAWWQSKSESSYKPLLDTKEVAQIEQRIATTSDRKEALKLTDILRRSKEDRSDSYSEILAAAMEPKPTVIHQGSDDRDIERHVHLEEKSTTQRRYELYSDIER